MSSDMRGRVEEIEGRRGDCLIVPDRSSCCTLVELFQAGRLIVLVEGDDSGVMLCECQCEGVIGAGDGLPEKFIKDERGRSTREGSVDGARTFFGGGVGAS